MSRGRFLGLPGVSYPGVSLPTPVLTQGIPTLEWVPRIALEIGPRPNLGIHLSVITIGIAMAP